MKIEKKIIGYKVLTEKNKENLLTIEPVIQRTKVLLTRPEVLSGTTYKIKPLVLQHGLYITINNIVVEDKVLPYELFISSKNVELFHFMEVLSLTITTLFRLQQDITHLLEEYSDIPAMGGDYWGKPKVKGEKGKFYKSFIGEIADIIKTHIDGLALQETKVSFEEIEIVDVADVEYPEEQSKMLLCPACNTRNALMLDGCLTCTSCYYSKCG